MTDEEQKLPGDIVVYKDLLGEVTHVAVVLDPRPGLDGPIIDVISKWGAEGEYIHAVNYVPDLCGTPAEYWTERKAP
ncbi:MAG TPA: hypothetical protein VJX67_23945 [Blastocatellia bacterium]|nr:hypothetical protein [Blastocatellia bacterium]